MKRTTIFVESDMERDLYALARRERRPVAAIVREAVAQYIAGARHRQGAELGFVAAGRSGRHDVAERHEDLLWHDLDPHGDRRPSPGNASRRTAARRTRRRARRP